MSNSIQNEYAPDYVSHPGETLEELLEERGITQAELAERTGRPRKTISEIISGKAAITPETAQQLELVLDVPARFWNNLQRDYEEAKARQQELKDLAEQTELLYQVPLRDMLDKKWIRHCEDKLEQVREVLRFFGVASFDRWQVVWGSRTAYFRKSQTLESDPGAIAAWLCRGEIEAAKIDCEPYNESKFRAALQQIRALTTEPQDVFQPEIVRLCAAAGVAVVLVPELSKTRTSGATQWLRPDKALIQLSLRYKTDDHFWFTFFHEAGHIIHHPKRTVFLEFQEKPDSQEEKEANTFAANILIPPDELKRFLASTKRLSKATIEQFAAQIGIAPGIVVGRLQHHEGVLPPDHCNGLKRKLKWAKN